MYYDKRFEPQIETKADPFKLETLIAWLEKQNPIERYDYCTPRDCVLGQYLRAHGVARHILLADEVRALGFYPVAYGQGERTWTFGAALDRARKLQSA